MDVSVELLVDDVWVAEEDKTGFLSFWSGYFQSIIFFRTTNSLAHGANEDHKLKVWEMRIIEKNSTNRIMRFLINDQNYYAWLYPPVKNSKNQNFSIN